MALKKKIPYTKPAFPNFDRVEPEFKDIVSRGEISSSVRSGKYASLLEQSISKYLGVKYSVAVSSGFSALMLVLRCLDLKSEVITSSFTFPAVAHAIIWNRLKPVFVDIDPATWNINTRLIERNVTSKTNAILAINTFSNPCNITHLEKIARKYKLKLIFDSAPCFGSLYKDEYIGNFGDAEIFSLSYTKLLTAGLGGLIITNDKKLYEKLKIGRNYGHSGDYNCKFFGINAKLSELNAIIGIKSLENFTANLKRIDELKHIYKSKLSKIPGISFQRLNSLSKVASCYFPIIIDPDKFGVNRDRLADLLLKEGIETKKYFYPPIHRQKAYRDFLGEHKSKLPVTEKISETILCLPLYAELKESEVNQICEFVERYSSG